jgi:3-deoxy-D-manno-octulosonic-acid transferase
MKRRRCNLVGLLVVNVAYLLAAVVGWPVYLFMLATRKKYRHRAWERWGFAPPMHESPLGREPQASASPQGPTARVKPPRLWVHAISVGEVEAARTFVPALAEAYPQAEIVLSTTTLTGRERAQKLFPGLPVFYWPMDLAPCVLLALARVRPTAIIQVESEWWPNFFFLAALAAIPVVCVNVRITEKGLRGYRRIRPIMRAAFNSASAVGVQAEVYRERLEFLGADPGRLHLTGQMKHDAVVFADGVPGSDDLAREMRIEKGEQVLVAGSTAPGEEAILLAAYREARRAFPRLRLVLVPRRPENFEAAAQAVLSAECGCIRRSRCVEWQGPKRLPPVILGDTMGELLKWYALADLVFLGRTLVPLGGSNPMEPGALGKPLLWGPHMFNFPVEAPAMAESGAAVEVEDAPALAAALIDLLTHADRRRQMGDAARNTIRRMQGATARNIALVRDVLQNV